ncbi:acyl carrier protein [Paraburkholderia sp. MMS20-SJTN17]|uniref:Acyl carrier protein n=1 Tax=Paraburkholderia translucens TaxID=2886945 RepID=A0ABS8KFX4_9BURK|nr:acyl carrier protein [Paraburkholderia sp. MMS20-SJTN17]MCC8403287.1 acyl carrier protein [Paraburkholderia sp. MMS20-SJTN17]
MKNELRQIITNVAHLDILDGNISDDADLYEIGLSSLNTIQLLLAIEDHFNLEIPDRMLSRSLFQSIDSLANAITQLQRDAQPL